MDHGIVIVGASLAGAKAAETLRDEGYTGLITLIGDEPDRPYERPPLSKGYLLGTEEREKAFCHPADWYSQHGVTLRLSTRATGIDPDAHEVHLGDERVSYDSLLLTTGSVVRKLNVPGSDLAGVHYLRRLSDSEAIGADLREGARIVVVGGGWIGMEVAAAAAQRGASVTVVELDDIPLRVLGDEVALLFGDLHDDHGVTFQTNTGVREFTGTGRVDGVLLSDGTRLAADAVVVGVGVAPATELAETAGLRVDDGVVTDARFRTSALDVFAAGDVANTENPLLGRPVRVEHWANARYGGPAAARSILGSGDDYAPVPYFFSDQYDLGMEYAGYVPDNRYDDVVFRGDLPNRRFLVFWMVGGRVAAGMNVNIWDVNDDIAALVRSGATVNEAKLADESVPLRDLI